MDELTFQRRALERVYGKRHRDAMANTKVHSASESEVNGASTVGISGLCV